MTDRAFIQRVRDRIAAQPSVPASIFFDTKTNCFCLVGAAICEHEGRNPWASPNGLLGIDEAEVSFRLAGKMNIDDLFDVNDKGGKEAVLAWLDARLAETAGETS